MGAGPAFIRAFLKVRLRRVVRDHLRGRWEYRQNQDPPEEIPKLTEALKGTMLTGERVREFEAEETCRAIPLTAAVPPVF